MNVCISLLDYCGHTYISRTQFSFYQDEMFCSTSNLHFFFLNLFSTYITPMCVYTVRVCALYVWVSPFSYIIVMGTHMHFRNQILNFQLCEFTFFSPGESSLLLVIKLKCQRIRDPQIIFFLNMTLFRS